MKRLLMTAVLTVALSSLTIAGQIPTDGSPVPAPNPTPTTAPAPGDMGNGGKAEQISDAALSAVLSVLSFLV